MGEKIRVKRANVVLEISPEDKDYYKSQGYSVVGEDGSIIEKAMSNDVGTLQKEVAELTLENQKLKDEIKKLKSETKATKKVAKKDE